MRAMTAEEKAKFIATHTAAYVKDGYNLNQAKSLAWSEFFEYQEMRFGLGYRKSYDCFCRDCGASHVFGAAGSIRTFIDLHRGHKTRTLSY